MLQFNWPLSSFRESQADKLLRFFFSMWVGKSSSSVNGGVPICNILDQFYDCFTRSKCPTYIHIYTYIKLGTEETFGTMEGDRYIEQLAP